MKKTRRECLHLTEAEGLNNIVKVYDWFSENNTAYIITEFIKGTTLESRVRKLGHYQWNELYRKFKPLMQSLSTLHQKGVIHRDIKPQNIMIKNIEGIGEQFVLIDFGLAKSTAAASLSTLSITYTPGYAPLEQCTSTTKDSTYTDVYSLAATLYFSLTGKNPNTDMHFTIEENFPRINVLTSEYNVPINVVQGLKSALAPNYKQRCSTIPNLLRMFGNVPRTTIPNVPSKTIVLDFAKDNKLSSPQENPKKNIYYPQPNNNKLASNTEKKPVLNNYIPKTSPIKPILKQPAKSQITDKVTILDYSNHFVSPIKNEAAKPKTQSTDTTFKKTDVVKESSPLQNAVPVKTPSNHEDTHILIFPNKENKGYDKNRIISQPPKIIKEKDNSEKDLNLPQPKNQYVPHYLRGLPKQSLNNQDKNEVHRNVSYLEKSEIKSNYKFKKAEREEAQKNQQSEIDKTIKELLPNYIGKPRTYSSNRGLKNFYAIIILMILIIIHAIISNQNHPVSIGIITTLIYILVFLIIFNND